MGHQQEQHEKREKALADYSWRTEKRTAHERGYTYAWKKARDRYLMSNALCVMCIELEARITPASVVDHVKPHKGDMVLFWDETNWQALCVSHHSSHKQRLERSGKETRVIGEDGWPIDDVVIPEHLLGLIHENNSVVQEQRSGRQGG